MDAESKHRLINKDRHRQANNKTCGHCFLKASKPGQQLNSTIINYCLKKFI